MKTAILPYNLTPFYSHMRNSLLFFLKSIGLAKLVFIPLGIVVSFFDFMNHHDHAHQIITTSWLTAGFIVVVSLIIHLVATLIKIFRKDLTGIPTLLLISGLAGALPCFLLGLWLAFGS